MNQEVRDCCLDTVSLPFALSGGISTVGCYLNYLETETVIFLPVFSIEQEGVGVAAPLGCVIFSVSVEIAACMPCAQGLSVCARRGVVSLPSACFACC